MPAPQPQSPTHRGPGQQAAVPSVGFSKISFRPKDVNGNVPAAGFDALGLVAPINAVVRAELRPAAGGDPIPGVPSPQMASGPNWLFSFGPVAPGTYDFFVEIVNDIPNATVNVTAV